jgi:MFS family permease
VLISGGTAIGPLISGFMIANTSDTWRSSVWLCFGVAILDLILMFIFYPESNFDRPQESFDQSQILQETYRSAKNENTQSEEFVEDSSPIPPMETTYTIRTPLISEILQPVSYNSDLNFFMAMFEPLKLLAHPSVVWAIFTYAISLSPQVILMYV